MRTEKLPEEESIKPIFVEPTWVLAGWAADDQGYVNPYRPTANLLMFVLEQLLAHQDKGFALFDNDIGLDAITTLPIMVSMHKRSCWLQIAQEVGTSMLSLVLRPSRMAPYN